MHAAREGTNFPLHSVQSQLMPGTSYLKPSHRHPLPSTKKSYADAVSQGVAKPPFKNFKKLTPFHYFNSRTTRLKCFKCGGFNYTLEDCGKLMRLCFNCSRSGHIARFCKNLSSKQSNLSSTFNNFPHQSRNGINHSNKGFSFRSKNDNLVWQSYAPIRSLSQWNLHVKLPVSISPSRQKKSFWRPNGRLLSLSFTQADSFKPTEDFIMDDLMGEAEVEEAIMDDDMESHVQPPDHPPTHTPTLQPNFSDQNLPSITSARTSSQLPNEPHNDITPLQTNLDNPLPLSDTFLSDNTLMTEQAQMEVCNSDLKGKAPIIGNEPRKKEKLLTGEAHNGAFVCFTSHSGSSVPLTGSKMEVIEGHYSTIIENQSDKGKQLMNLEQSVQAEKASSEKEWEMLQESSNQEEMFKFKPVAGGTAKVEGNKLLIEIRRQLTEERRNKKGQEKKKKACSTNIVKRSSKRKTMTAIKFGEAIIRMQENQVLEESLSSSSSDTPLSVKYMKLKKNKGNRKVKELSKMEAMEVGSSAAPCTTE